MLHKGKSHCTIRSPNTVLKVLNYKSLCWLTCHALWHLSILSPFSCLVFWKEAGTVGKRKPYVNEWAAQWGLRTHNVKYLWLSLFWIALENIKRTSDCLSHVAALVAQPINMWKKFYFMNISFFWYKKYLKTSWRGLFL